MNSGYAPLSVVALDDYQGLTTSLGLEARLPGSRWTALREHLEGEQLASALSEATVVIAMRERTALPASLFRQLPALKLLITTGMSNTVIDFAAAAAHGVTVCGTTPPRPPREGASGMANTAELAWSLLLSLARSIPAEAASVRNGGWQQSVGADLSGATLGIVGLGRIGSLMPPVARAFGLDVIAWSPHLDEARAAGAGARLAGKDELFATADFVTVHLGLSAATTGIIGRPELRAMKPTAYLVNTSRGPLVDASALLQALREGWIAGAALDVFDTEPLPADSPFRTAPRLIATPHLGFVTRRTLEHWYDEAVENIDAWRAGRPLRIVRPAG
jgi:phosphoglycerate dehydrogenase-like enzyme